MDGSQEDQREQTERSQQDSIYIKFRNTRNGMKHSHVVKLQKTNDDNKENSEQGL